MSRWYTVDPVKVCAEQHTNATVAYHECLCQFNYSTQKRKMGLLKFRHCALADELRKQMDFDMYKIIGISCVIFVVVAIVLFCSFKWYQQTRKNPCAGCCGCLPCLSGKKKKNRRRGENGHCNGRAGGHDTQDSSAGFDEHWVNDMNTDLGSLHSGHNNGRLAHSENRKNKNTLCMKFCLSEPVQDCCEFLDCDLMWHKKNVYAQPYFGKSKKNSGAPAGGKLNGAYGMTSTGAGNEELPTLQRRPTRPAPPPPQLPGAPGSAMHNVPVFEDGSLIVDDDIVCEPIPEAPPSPEPVRRPQQPDQPRSIYVDPLAFLQKPFLRLSIALSGRDSNFRDSRAESRDEDEPDALYSRVKDFVMSKVRKSGSVASLNRASGSVSGHPDGGPDSPTKSKSKYGKTGSLASLHDITETELDKSYDGSKRSMSLASLSAVGSSHLANGKGPSRHASKNDIADEDVPPSQRGDEYIDLEEMARKMAARMQQQAAEAPQMQSARSTDRLHHSGSPQPVVITSQPLSAQALHQANPLNNLQNHQANTLQNHPSNALNNSQNHHIHNPHPAVSAPSQPYSSTSTQSQPFPSSSAHNSSSASMPQLSPTGKTPDFIPASAYTTNSRPNPQPENKRPADYEIGPSVLYPNNSQQNNTSATSSVNASAFSPANYSGLQSEALDTSVTTLVDATGTVPVSIVQPNTSHMNGETPSNGVHGALVPYSTSRMESLNSSVSSTPAGTLKRQKPSVPPRPAALTDNPNYRSLGRPTVAPPSPKFMGRAAPGPYGAAAPIPQSPLMAGKMGPPMAGLSLHEQQLLQQQMLQQQQLQQFYLQQNPQLNPAYQQLLLQQQLQQEHTIMTPSVQQQVLQEQQLYQQMLQQQQFQMQQQYLQQQLMQQQLQQGMRYRQPLSSTSSTGSSASSKSSRSLHKPTHPPPPPPTGPPHPSLA